MEEKLGNGFLYVTEYSEKFKRLIRKIADVSAKESLGKDLNGIGIFLFGSPSRQEMVDESDADILIIRYKNSDDYRKFRKVFLENLKKEKFPKIDIPEWGSLEDCETYIKNCITEGNQVIEAKFLYGDINLAKDLSEMRNKYSTTEKFERIICFQKFYFDQYYKQRTLHGVKNVKYGHGGTRDLMFVTWFSNLMDLNENKRINFEDSFPHAHKSLSQLYSRGLINYNDYLEFLKQVEIVLILRNQILIQNRGTESEGITYLDEKSLETLFKRKIFNSDTITTITNLEKYLKGALNGVAKLKNLVWELFLDYLKKNRGLNWYERFINVLNGNISYEILESIGPEDILTRWP
mgnify:FL=1